LLAYLADTQLSDLRQITTLSTYEIDGYMSLDAQTRRNLELFESGRGERRHSLVAVLDQTRTPLGARLLRRWLNQPLRELDPLHERQEAVGRFHADALARANLRQALGAIGDLERLVNRAVTSIATPHDLGELRTSLAQLPAVAAAAGKTPGAPDLEATLATAAEVHALLAAAITDEPADSLGKSAAIRPGFAPELDGHRTRAREAREWIANLERQERERTGIKSLKVGYNKVFGYYLEITAAALANANGQAGGSVLPEDYIAKQSLANATRYFTPQLKEYEAIVLTAQDTLSDLEADVFHRVMSQVAARAPRLLAAANAVAYLDVASNLAEVAVVRDYVRPTLDESGAIEIEAGRHPTLESLIGRAEYVPNDATLDVDGAQVTIVTGPNMAGKSSYLRQVGLIVLLAQIGSYVPARAARIGLVDRIFTRIGAQDDIATGQSTFMVEMLETANILNHATGRSLVILDEIGRGTSTYDGLAIARAIVEHLHNAPRLGCRTLFATHYHELTELEAILPRVRSCRMDVLEDGDRVVFLRRVVAGAADRSYGVHVAQLAGIPRAVVRRATEILHDLEGGKPDRDERSSRRDAMRSSPPQGSPSVQMTLFAPPNPALEELRNLDVESLSPLEAITRLFELQQLANQSD
jgi:DNA mismatch repair protein MutS